MSASSAVSIAGEMSSTASSTAAAPALLRHRPRTSTSHFFLGKMPNTKPAQSYRSPPPKPIAAVASHLLRRREASLALSSLCIASVFDASVAAGAEMPECSLSFAASGLAFCDKVVGSGMEATKGQLIKAHYVGRLENGKVFDSSYGRGMPLTFRVGVGEVIKGWDQGILGGEGIPPMLAGGMRTLRLPPELGYGARGAGCRGGTCIIPPDSTLLFDIEFIGKA